MTEKHSIIVPVYNEIDGLENLFKRLVSLMADLKYPFEVILVNDGSEDGSAEKLEQIHARDPRFKIIHFSRNFGHQAAVMAGMRLAIGQTVTLLDADLQDPPELILQFIQKWKEGYEVVYGIRRNREGETFLKRISAWLFYRTLRFLTRVDIPVNTGDFRLMDRIVVDSIIELQERNPYIRGLVSWVGYRQIGIEYERKAREAGVTHYPFINMLRFARDGITSFSSAPLHFATYLGLCTSGISAIGLFYTFYLKFFTDKTIAGWTSLIAVLLFFSGVQLLCIGILGEYIARIFSNVRQRPLYLIRKTSGFERQEGKP
jgi:dolichol-phosphate mannosyltransferase